MGVTRSLDRIRHFTRYLLQLLHQGSKANVARLPFLLTEDKKYGDDEPFRTYKGMKYQGGISDHLPIYADFELIVY